MNDDARMQVLALGAMVFAVGAAVVLGGMQDSLPPVSVAAHWLADVETGADHIAPEELAAEILGRRDGLVLVDVRPPEEFAAFHLPGAVNLTVPEVAGVAGEAVFAAQPRLVVLYSNGPAHPAQAWVELRRQGRTNVRVLDGGLDAFKARLLTPPSLAGWLDERTANALRPGHVLRAAFFAGGATAVGSDVFATDPERLDTPTMVSTGWLAQRLTEVAVVDVRPAVEYAALHLPGAVRLDVDSLRRRHGDRPLFLRSADELARSFGALGLRRDRPVVLVAGDRLADATLATMAFLRAGHRAIAILEGGILRWAAEQLPLTEVVPAVTAVTYEPLRGADDFTIGIDDLAAEVREGRALVLDVRPAAAFSGEESTEARPGHVPGAVNRPHASDVVVRSDGVFLRGRSELAAAYRDLGLEPDDPIVLSCRSGHTASQSWFVLRFLLGYRNVKWFNGSWIEWAERADLPAATGAMR